jgi:S1-C subfamily serine protease
VTLKDRYPDQDKVGTLGLSVTQDRTIDSFESNSSGQKAGLVVGDVITTIDGIDVTAAAGRVVYVLTLAPIGTTIRVGVARGVTIAAATVGL